MRIADSDDDSGSDEVTVAESSENSDSPTTSYWLVDDAGEIDHVVFALVCPETTNQNVDNQLALNRGCSLIYLSFYTFNGDGI